MAEQGWAYPSSPPLLPHLSANKPLLSPALTKNSPQIPPKPPTPTPLKPSPVCQQDPKPYTPKNPT